MPKKSRYTPNFAASAPSQQQIAAWARGMLEAVDKLTEEEIFELHSNDNYQSYGEAIIDKMLEKSSVAPIEREISGVQSRAN